MGIVVAAPGLQSTPDSVFVVYVWAVVTEENELVSQFNLFKASVALLHAKTSED